MADTKQAGGFPKLIKEMSQELAKREGNVLAAPYLFVVTSDLTKSISIVSMSTLHDDARKAARKVREQLKNGANEVAVDPPQETDKPTLLAPSQKWTNSKGAVITAAVVKIDGEKVVFRMADGKDIAYMISKLSADSQAKLKALNE